VVTQPPPANPASSKEQIEHIQLGMPSAKTASRRMQQAKAHPVLTYLLPTLPPKGKQSASTAAAWH